MAEIGEHGAVRRRGALRRRRHAEQRLHAGGRELAHRREVELSEAGVAGQLAAQVVRVVGELGAAVEQREHLRDHLAGVGRAA